MRAAKYKVGTVLKSIERLKFISIFVVISAAVLIVIAVVPGRSSSKAGLEAPLRVIMNFSTMVGVDDNFVDSTAIRGIPGDELPWEVDNVSGTLTTDGHLQLNVTGVVFAHDPSVPPELQGINDEDQFRAVVSCLTNGRDGHIATRNITTAGFPATRTGNSNIDTFVPLSNPCFSPIVFIIAGSENKWFTVTGAYLPPPPSE